MQPDYNPSAITESSADVDDEAKEKMQRLFKAEGVRGCARVICFSPLHHLTMAEMQASDILPIIKEWINQVQDLSKLDYVNYVQLFVRPLSKTFPKYLHSFLYPHKHLIFLL